MSFEQARWVWKNGELIPWKDATVHVSAHALHYGSGVFEGIRCYDTAEGPAVFRLDVHLDRLYDSGSVYGIEIPYNKAQLAEAVCEVIRCNGFRSCYVRPICFFGSGSLALNPQKCPVEVVIFAWPWETYLGAKALEGGVRVTVSPWVKFHSSMMPTTAKACGQYLNSILAVREAMSRGYDEALLLGADGSIAEGSGENIFLVHRGKLLTNDERHSILLGVTRDAMIEIACNLGLPVETRAIQVSDLLSADEAFFVGTAAEVTPIREVDGQLIGSGARGPLTTKIQQAFFAATSGRDPKYRHWLHLVASGLSKPVPATEATSLCEAQRSEIEHREGSAALARKAAHCDPA
jgi:branched-chain amino acid aminotransferase